MLEQDEMFRLLVTRYATKLVKPKKQASYMTQEKKQEAEELPLSEAIAKKTDGKLMDDAYNPTAVERHWNTWWEQKYPLIHSASSSTPTTRPPTPKNSPSASPLPTSQGTSTSDTPSP